MALLLHHKVFFVEFLFHAALSTIFEPKCYFPDGNVNSSGYICNITAVEDRANSPCCRIFDSCFANGVVREVDILPFVPIPATYATIKRKLLIQILTVTVLLLGLVSPLNDGEWFQ